MKTYQDFVTEATKDMSRTGMDINLKHAGWKKEKYEKQGKIHSYWYTHNGEQGGDHEKTAKAIGAKIHKAPSAALASFQGHQFVGHNWTAEHSHGTKNKHMLIIRHHGGSMAAKHGIEEQYLNEMEDVHVDGNKIGHVQQKNGKWNAFHKHTGMDFSHTEKSGAVSALKASHSKWKSAVSSEESRRKKLGIT